MNNDSLSKDFNVEASYPADSQYSHIWYLILHLLDLHCPDFESCRYEEIRSYQELREHLIEYHKNRSIHLLNIGWSYIVPNITNNYVVALLDRLFLYGRHGRNERFNDEDYMIARLDIPLIMIERIRRFRTEMSFWETIKGISLKLWRVE